MSRLSAWCALAAFGGGMALAGDWLGLGGDARHSGWQTRGNQISTTSVKELKLLWKRPTDAHPSAPVILGPTITHRGVRELVFVATASNKVFAYDADLGSLFWMREIKSDVPACASKATPTPVIEPNPRPRKEDDEPNAMRPIYVPASDGMLHKIRASDGADSQEPVKFLPPGANSSSLNFSAGVVYAVTSNGCGGARDGVWAIDLKAPGAPAFSAVKDGGAVSVAADGSIHVIDGNKILTLSAHDLRVTHTFTASTVLGAVPIEFEWQGAPLVLAAGKHGLVLDGAAHAEASGEFDGGMATWQDSSGTRWIYASTATGVSAFKLTGSAAQPKVEASWSQALERPGPIAIVNGVVFVLGAGAKLHALDAAGGTPLYTSAGAATPGPYVPALAIANGHVIFTTTDGTLYCFGIPIEQQ